MSGGEKASLDGCAPAAHEAIKPEARPKSRRCRPPAAMPRGDLAAANSYTVIFTNHTGKRIVLPKLR
jgi:hypothetical protein